MKKLMIAAAIVCAAAMSQAAGYKWQSGMTGAVLYDGTADAKAYDTYGAMTLYMFDVATYSQSEMFTKLSTGTDIATLTAATSTSLSTASKITTKEFDYGTHGQNYSLYFAAVFDDDPNTFYISSVMADKTSKETGATTLSYGDLTANSKTTFNVADGFKGAGVYAAAVPEPTSGLLLLLGVAGMALRRRRA